MQQSQINGLYSIFTLLLPCDVPTSHNNLAPK